jgi:hypothetical protein
MIIIIVTAVETSNLTCKTILSCAVIYGLESLSLALWEEQWLRETEKKSATENTAT